MTTFKTKLLNGATALLAGAALLGSAAVAQAAPVKIESENITFLGDVDPQLAAERVRKWEIYRKMVYALSGVSNPPADKEKLTIYGFKSTSDLQKFMGARRSGIAGVYTNGNTGPIFLTSVNEDAREEGFSEQVGLHEYTHHVTNAFVKQGFPRWYGEGFANYLSTMDINGDVVTIGDPSTAHVKAMATNRIQFLDPETIFKSYSMYPNYSRRDRKRGGVGSYYGQSQLYVSLLMTSDKYKDKLADYLNNLEVGIKPIEAFETAYGVTIEEFDKEARNMFKKEEFILTPYMPGPEITSVKMKRKKLSEAQLAKEMIPGRMTFSNRNNKGAFKKQLKEAFEADPSDIMVTLGYVSMDIADKNYDRALQRGMALYSVNPNDHDAIRAVADAKYHKAIDAIIAKMPNKTFEPYPEPEGVKEAMAHYKKILAENPIDFDAVQHVAGFYGNNELPVDDLAFQAARALDVKFMDNFNPSWGMDIAVIYAKKGYTADACSYYYQTRNELEDRDWDWGDSKMDWFKANYGAECQDPDEA